MRKPTDIMLLALFATGRLTFQELDASETRNVEQDTAQAIEALEDEFGITMEQFESIADALVQLAGRYEDPQGNCFNAFSTEVEEDRLILLYPTQIDGEALEITHPHLH